MMKMIKLIEFMKGRYGVDNLSKFILNIYLVILITNLFIKNIYLTLIEILLLLIIIFRTLSKNIYKRVKENRQFLEIRGKIIEPFRKIKKKLFTKKTNIYKKCPKCKQKIKLPLPKKRGIKHTTCPTCKTRFGFLCLTKK